MGQHAHTREAFAICQSGGASLARRNDMFVCPTVMAVVVSKFGASYLGYTADALYAQLRLNNGADPGGPASSMQRCQRLCGHGRMSWFAGANAEELNSRGGDARRPTYIRQPPVQEHEDDAASATRHGCKRSRRRLCVVSCSTHLSSLRGFACLIQGRPRSLQRTRSLYTISTNPFV